MNQELLQEFESATDRFFQLLASHDQQSINQIPARGGWTAAQVGEHIFKSDTMLLEWLNRADQPAGRPVDAGVAGIRSQFLDFSVTFESPEQIVPSNGTHDKEALLSALKAIRGQIREIIANSDLNTVATDTLLGNPTRLEMINFVNVHTLRHVNQLEKIKNGVDRK